MRSTHPGFRILICLMGLGLQPALARAQHPPDPPVITSPTSADSVSPDDVHMETAPMSDPDPGDVLAAANWELRVDATGELVWFEYNSTPSHAVHTHLGDGAFVGSYSGRTSLMHSTTYRVRVQHQDNTGLWSPWSELAFVTTASTTIAPFVMDGVAPGPVSLEDLDGAPVFLPDGPDPGHILLEGFGAGPVLAITGSGGVADSVGHFPTLPVHAPLRVSLYGGSGSLHLPECTLRFPLDTGRLAAVHLPGAGMAPGDTTRYWVSSDGSAWPATLQDAGPNFTTHPATNPDIPWQPEQDGYCVERVAGGFELPMALAFLPHPGAAPGDPLLYVAELYGDIQVVHRDGSVTLYASNLLNFDPTGQFPGSGEQGLGGLCVDPASGDLFVTLVYDAAPPNGPHYPRILRLHSTDGGLTASSSSVVLDLAGEPMTESHYISNITLGPDGKLYVHVGDGLLPSTALDPTTFRGKILRMNVDGTAPPDNPFYDASNGITAADYIFASGFRNPFGGVWRQSEGRLYEVENGTTVNDRLARVDRGRSYGWNGVDDSLTIGAIYNWSPTHAPVQVACVEPEVFAGSGFPPGKSGHFFVTESGPTYAPGTDPRGKRIVEFEVDASGKLVSGPTQLVEYFGFGRATAAGLAAGPDGLYFTDLYKDHGDGLLPTDRGANVYRIRYVGSAPCTPEFSVDRCVGLPPLGVQFGDANGADGSDSRSWQFGDGSQAGGLDPLHAFAHSGLYDVRLDIAGSGGTTSVTRKAAVLVGGSRRGLRAQYFAGLNFDRLLFERTEPGVQVDFGWLSPAPGAAVDSFSVRWTGKVIPAYSETYTFHVTSDDGARLWVNNQLVVDRWQPQALTDWSGSIKLSAGIPADVRLEYFEQAQVASCQLSWQSASQPLEVIPGSQCFWIDSTAAAGVPKPLAARSPVLRVVGSSPSLRQADLEFAIGSAGPALLRVFDVQGRVVTTLFHGSLREGETRRARFGPGRVAAGVYFARLSWNGGSRIRRILLLH